MNGPIKSFDLQLFLMRFGIEDVCEVGNKIQIVCCGLGLHPNEKDEISEVVEKSLDKRVVFVTQAS